MKLSRDFFNRNVVDVARDLIGQSMFYGDYHGIITETEAYGGKNDEASHAFKGPTPRANIMFGPSGRSYVYLIYGMYHCLNIVANTGEDAGAVLIRGVKILSPEVKNLDGPGKLCMYLDISKNHNDIDLVESENFYLTYNNVSHKILATPRIGIKKATEKLWRFILE